MSKAVLPGSYDPITRGHLEIIKRASAEFDEVFVALMINPEKEYMFEKDDRVSMARIACEDIPNVTVVYDEGMLVDLFERLGADVIVKGVRNKTDYEYESDMAQYNEKRNPRAVTLLWQCEAEYAGVSSSSVRKAIREGDLCALESLLDRRVLEYINKKA